VRIGIGGVKRSTTRGAISAAVMSSASLVWGAGDAAGRRARARRIDQSGAGDRGRNAGILIIRHFGEYQ